MTLVVNFILIVGILLNVIAILGLMRLIQKELPQHILILFWFLMLGVLIYFYASLHDLSVLKFIANYIEDGVRLLIPPLLFIYIKSIFIRKDNLIKRNLIHFIPFFIYLVVYTIPKSINSDLHYIELTDEYVDWALIQDLFGIAYFIISLKLFYRVSKTMKQNYSNLGEKDFLWLEKFLISFLIVLIIDLILTISEISFDYNVTWDSYITVFFIVVAMSYLGYYGLTQSTVFLPDFLIDNHVNKSDQTTVQTLYIKDDEKVALRETFEKFMNEEKLYLSSDLSLGLLADKMGISERKLSAFFNEAMNSSFYDTINSYRVEEAKSRLRSNIIKSQSITGIGLSCGFSSKSSFYRIFKKNTSLSPSAYRSSVLK